MKVRRIFPLVFSLALGLVAGDTKALALTLKPGDPGVYQFGSSLYKLVDGPTWTEAEANAVLIGGHLVTYNSKEEAEWAGATFCGTCIGGEGGGFGVWNGLNDLDVVGEWRWVSGEPVTYLAWGAGNPDFIGIERYVGGFTGWGNADIVGTGLTATFMRGLAEVPYTPTDVPGPLPILGAAAAFGYSRKLRKRITLSKRENHGLEQEK